EDGGEQLGTGQGTGGVVDHHHAGVVGDGGKATADGGGTGGPAGDHEVGAVVVGIGGEPVVRQHQDDAVGDGSGGVDRPGDDGPTGQVGELFGPAEAGSGPAGDHHGPDGAYATVGWHRPPTTAGRRSGAARPSPRRRRGRR